MDVSKTVGYGWRTRNGPQIQLGTRHRLSLHLLKRVDFAHLSNSPTVSGRHWNRAVHSFVAPPESTRSPPCSKTRPTPPSTSYPSSASIPVQTRPPGRLIAARQRSNSSKYSPKSCQDMESGWNLRGTISEKKDDWILLDVLKTEKPDALGDAGLLGSYRMSALSRLPAFPHA